MVPQGMPRWGEMTVWGGICGEGYVGMAAFGHPAERSEAPGTNPAGKNSGVGNGNRTRNRRSHSPVLCQLSYSHHHFGL